jgi:hypothetical protein
MASPQRSLPTQIRELEDEVLMRQQVFKRRVDAGQMKQAEMDYRIDTIRASIATLKKLHAHVRLIRQRCPEVFAGDA